MGLMLTLISLRTKNSLERVRASRKTQGASRLLVSVLVFAVSMLLVEGQLFAAEDDEVTNNLTIEYHYLEGEEDQVDIPETIIQFGREYRLLEVTDPVLEDTLPDTRTYSYRIDGTLSPADLELIEGIDGIVLTPVDVVVERDVDKSEVVEGLPNNDVDYLPISKEFEIASANTPNMVTLDELDRAAVTYTITGYDEYGLPSSYSAQIVYRGIETFMEVGYYMADTIYTRDVTLGETPLYVILATYEPVEVEEELPEMLVIEVPIDQELLPIEQSTDTDDTEEVIPTPAEVLGQLIDSGVPTMTIGNQEVPLWSGDSPYVWSLVNLILSIACILLVAITVIRFLVRKSHRDDETESQDGAPKAVKVKKTRIVWFVAALVLGFVDTVWFLLTQNMSYLMVLFDRWTVFYALVLVLVLVSHLLSFKGKKHDEPKPFVNTEDSGSAFLSYRLENR